TRIFGALDVNITLRLSHSARVYTQAPGPSPRTGSHNIEVAPRVAPDPVTRAKARIAPLGQALAVERQDADQSAVVLRDVHDVVGVHVERRRADQLRGPDL